MAILMGAIDAKGWAAIATAIIAAIGAPFGAVYAARQTRRYNDLKLRVDSAIASRQENRADGTLTLEVADRWRADNVTLREEIAAMRTEMRTLRDENRTLLDKVEHLEETNEHLTNRVRELERQLGSEQPVGDVS